MRANTDIRYIDLYNTNFRYIDIFVYVFPPLPNTSYRNINTLEF